MKYKKMQNVKPHCSPLPDLLHHITHLNKIGWYFQHGKFDIILESLNPGRKGEERGPAIWFLRIS